MVLKDFSKVCCSGMKVNGRVLTRSIMDSLGNCIVRSVVCKRGEMNIEVLVNEETSEEPKGYIRLYELLNLCDQKDIVMQDYSRITEGYVNMKIKKISTKGKGYFFVGLKNGE